MNSTARNQPSPDLPDKLLGYVARFAGVLAIALEVLIDPTPPAKQDKPMFTNVNNEQAY